MFVCIVDCVNVFVECYDCYFEFVGGYFCEFGNVVGYLVLVNLGGEFGVDVFESCLVIYCVR